MAKKSLSEQIAELANKPKFQDFDIEDEDFHNGKGNKLSASSSDDDESDNEQTKKEHYVSMGKSKLRKDNGDDAQKFLQDAKYTGSKGTREELFGDNFGAKPEGDEEEEEDEEEDGESGSDSGVDLDDVSSSGEDQSSEGSEAGEDDEEEEEDSDVEDRRSKLLKLKTQTQQIISKSYTSSQTKDALKGYSIIQQNKFFDNIIDSRIKLQKAMNISNSLPLTQESWDSFKNKKTDSLISENSDLLTSVLNKIIDIRFLLQKNDKINTSIDDKTIEKEIGSKRSIDSITESAENLDSQLKKYRKVVLYKWSNKINQTQGSSSNSNSISSKKFSTVNQTSDVQVETQLADQQRLLKRTYLNRRGVVPLNFDHDYQSGSLSKLKPESRELDQKDEDDNELDIPKNYNPRLKSNIDTSENPYIFDDEDFYRVLLNDLVDKKINTANSSTSNQQQQLQQQQVRLVTGSTNKIKNKNIDTKASKGRKLNFQVQEPIAHYEAPVNNSTKWSDLQIDEFFAGLLGQGVDFDEDDRSDSSDVEQEDDDAQDIKNDDIKIFG